jgi:hypothetical protein
MAKTKQYTHQPSLYIVAGAVAVVILAVASLAHADEDRGNRGHDRDREGGIKSFLSFKLNDRRGDSEKEIKHATSTKPTHQFLIGTVSSVSVTGNTLVLTGTTGTTTVSVTSDTKITGGATKLAEISAGDHVKATGTMNATTSVFAASKLTINHKEGLRQEHALKLIARLEAYIAQLKLRFGL